MKIIKIKDFSIEVSDDILDDYYQNMTNDEIVNKIVDEVQHQVGIFMCFEKYEVEND